MIRNLRSADASTRITWLHYYNAAGTGKNNIRQTPYIPLTCSIAFEWALNIVNSAIQAGLSADSQFIQIDKVMSFDNSLVQPLFLIQQVGDGTANPAGWPHPNMAGSQIISDLLAP